MLPHGLFRRRRWRLYALRTRSLVRHHYFSLISAVILGGAAFLAVAGDGFVDGSSRVKAVSEKAAQSSPTVSTDSAPRQPRRLIYYIVNSREQQEELQSAVRGDMTNLRNINGYDFGQVVYLLLDSPSEESFWARFLTSLVESAPRDGYELRIIDLRQ
jgi:hypothetical protein